MDDLRFEVRLTVFQSYKDWASIIKDVLEVGSTAVWQYINMAVQYIAVHQYGSIVE